MNIAIPKINRLNFNIQKKRISDTAKQSSCRSTVFSFCSNSIQKQELELYKKLERNFFIDFLNAKGKVTPEEYENIVKNHPLSLLKASEYCKNSYYGCITPRELADVVLETSRLLNERFPNARIISIGTSPSPITEQLQYLGHDIVFIPVSGFRKYDPKDKRLAKCPNFKILEEYIKSKKINNDKLNVVLDYTCSGLTLKSAREFIKNTCKIKDEHIKGISLNKLLKNSAFYKKSMNNLDIPITDCLLDMETSKIENISNIPHFPVVYFIPDGYDADEIFDTKNKTEQEIFRAFEEYSKPLARAFSLCTMHEINKKKEIR